MSNNIIKPDYYSKYIYQYTHNIDLMDLLEHLPFSIASAITYLARRKYKGQYLQDTKKAITYLYKYVELAKEELESGDLSKLKYSLFKNSKSKEEDKHTNFMVRGLLERSQIYTTFAQDDDKQHELIEFVQDLIRDLELEVANIESYSEVADVISNNEIQVNTKNNNSIEPFDVLLNRFVRPTYN